MDYPLHVGSGPFWEGSPEKLKRLTTAFQTNEIMKKYSARVSNRCCNIAFKSVPNQLRLRKERHQAE